MGKFLLLSVIIGVCFLYKQANSEDSLKCGANEVRNECYSPCEKTCKTRFRSDGKVCLAVCSTGCSCIEGHLRHDNGTCVPISECSPPICNKDEVYKECGTACQANCATYANNCTTCTKQCVEGCFCKGDTVRLTADSLTCSKPSDCPVPVCKGDYEYFDNCPKRCPHQNCSAIWTKIDCTKTVQCCEPQCRCENGYYRNKEYQCTSTQECIDTNGGYN